MVEPYFMARIVDVENFLKEYPFTLESDETLFLHITDDQAEWNNGSYLIDREGVKVFKGDKANATCAHPPKRGIRCTINTLTSVLTGYQEPFFLYEAGLLEGSKEDVARLQRIRSAKETNFMDFF